MSTAKKKKFIFPEAASGCCLAYQLVAHSSNPTISVGNGRGGVGRERKMKINHTHTQANRTTLLRCWPDPGEPSS